MALERPPKYSFLNPEAIKAYRPPDNEVSIWHTVTSGLQENFTTIAAKHRVPVDRIIGFNFPGSVENGRILTEVVNWYLHHHRGFGGPETRDRRNRMFKGGEKVAIPYISKVDIGEPIFLSQKKPTPLEGNGNILASEKFVHEFKIPPKAPADLGYLIAQARITIEGEVVQQGLLKTQFKKDQIKAQVEKKLDEDLKATFSAKFDQKTLDKIAEEVKKGSKEGFAKALGAPFEASLKQNYKFGKFAVVPEVGIDFGEFAGSLPNGALPAPVVIRLAGEYQDTLLVEGLMLQGKFVIKLGFNVGLSRKGWAWVLQRVGPEVLKRFLTSAGRSLAGVWEYLVAEGIVAAGGIAVAAIAGTIVITALTAWLVADARRKGELKGLASWYYSAYLAKVFGRPRPSGFIVGDTKMRDELILLGEKDAVAMAVSVVQRRGEQASYPTEAAALERFKEIAVVIFGSEEKAEIQLKKSLQAHIEKQIGL